MMNLRRVWAAVAVATVATATTHAAVIKVSPFGSDANSGATWGTAKATLAGALGVANPGDEIWVAQGNYSGASIGIDVKLYGGFDGTETVLGDRDPLANPTVLDGNDLVRILNIVHSPTNDLVIDGFVLEDGLAQQGAAIQWGDGSPVIRNNIFRNNVATASADFQTVYGGAIYGYSGSPHLERNRFEGNTASFTGTGLGLGAYGGAVFIYEGTPTVVANVFVNNVASDAGILRYGEGAGYYQYTMGGEFYSNVFAGNVSESYGGAVYTYEGTANVVNNTFVNNVSGADGSAFFNYTGTVNFINNVVVGNSTNAVYTFEATAFANNNCYWNNGANTFTGYTLGGANLAANPQLVNPAGGDFRLSGGSPCVNAGDDTALPMGANIDYLGGARIVGAAVDIGAHELSGALNTIAGRITLGDYLPNPSTQTIAYEVWQGGTMVESGNLSTNGAGDYTVTVGVAGVADIKMKGTHWLRRANLSVDVTGGVTGVDFSLLNGDIDGNNVIDSDDFDRLVQGFGQIPGDPGYDPATDLNGDTATDSDDFDILVRNFGLGGD